LTGNVPGRFSIARFHHVTSSHMNDLPIILASNSPRRRQLLRDWGYRFAVMAPSEAAEAPSNADNTDSAPQLVARLARQKAQDVAFRVDRGLVVACDTVVECQGRILGKPDNREHARQVLHLLRGQEHHVYSGLCLWQRPSDRHLIETDVTKLVMDPISDHDLARYLATRQWEGKAGAFGYQDGLDWVHVIEGSESNVVGLPMELLARMLSQFDQDR
jgi:nucleoside triphosphate pyrophosphatase